MEPGDFDRFFTGPFHDLSDLFLRAAVKKLNAGESLPEKALKKLDLAFQPKAHRKLKTFLQEVRRMAKACRILRSGKPLPLVLLQELRDFGDTLRTLEKDTNEAQNFPDDNPLVADVLDVTGPGLPPTPLFAARGRAHEILVLVSYQNHRYVSRGGVFTYYEWWGPDHQRVTDEQWRARLRGGSAPAPLLRSYIVDPED